MNYNDIIKEIGRGKDGATDLEEDTACALYDAMLDGQVPELELGALLVAFRIKGESEAEMRGFYRAMQSRMARLRLPQGKALPVLLPTHNGARRQGNLTPLLALMLQKLRVPVVVHGVRSDPKRVTSAEVFAALGLAASETIDTAQAGLDAGQVVFLPTEVLSPRLDALLQLRWRLGVRNSTHTLAKLLDPFDGQSVRVVSVSHPDYIGRMTRFFLDTQANGLLLRGTEGEVYANPKRCPRIVWFAAGQERVLVEAEEGVIGVVPQLPEEMDAAVTARWIEHALAGDVPIPQPLRTQVACCLVAAGVTPEMPQALAMVAEAFPAP